MAKKLLLADDSQTIHRVMELTFADEDFEIISVYNGAQAIEKIKEVKADLVIADVNMPEKDGYQVCQYIKNDPEFSNIPVILLKGTFEPFDEAKANACHYDGIIAKPFQTKNLINTVKDILSAMQPAGEEALVGEKENEVTPPEVSAPIATPPEEAPEPIIEEKEITIPEEQGVAVEQAALPAEKAPIVVEEEELKKPAEELPDLESLSEEEILGLEESSEEEILLEEMPPVKEEEAALAEAIETEAGEKEAAAEKDLAEEPGFPPKEAVPQEPAPSEPIEISEEEELFAGKEVSVAEAQPAVQHKTPPKGEIPKALSSPEFPISDEIIEQIANRIVEKISNEAVKQIAWEVIPDMAERFIKQAIDEIKKS